MRLADGARRALGSIGIPLLYAVGAIALGMVLPRLEARYLPELTSGAGAGAAIAVLSAIASGIMPLTGLVFSLAFVMVQFSATAYSPRLVSWFAGSAFMRHSLGVFTATFLYALSALAWIDRGGRGGVPLLTVWAAIVLLLVSIVFFVMLVERLAMLQISRVLAYAGDRGREVIERDYSALEPGMALTQEESNPPEELPAETHVISHRGGPAVIQALDIKGMVALAARHDAVLAMALAVGDTAVDGMPLVRVHGGKGPLSEDSVRRLVRLGTERTFAQDPKYAIRILVDIAIRALSPAINDPTTAVQALDQVEDLMIRLGRRSLSTGFVRDDGKKLRVVVPVPSWEDFLTLAFDEIRFFGATSIQVIRRMRALLQSLMDQVPEERKEAIEHYLQRIDKGIRKSFEEAEDRRAALEEDRQGLGLAREREQE
jgi:uncharacterized membrane protein